MPVEIKGMRPARQCLLKYALCLKGLRESYPPSCSKSAQAVLLLMLLGACAPSVDSCRIGSSNTQGIIHLGAEALSDADLGQFVLQHEFYHVWTGERDEFAADRFAEEWTIYRGVSPCPAARHLKRCGLHDRANALGVRNSCEEF